MCIDAKFNFGKRKRRKSSGRSVRSWFTRCVSSDEQRLYAMSPAREDEGSGAASTDESCAAAKTSEVVLYIVFSRFERGLDWRCPVREVR